MAKYARLNSAGLIMETHDGDPTTRFVESIASQFVEVDDNAATGDTYYRWHVGEVPAPEVTPPPAPTQPRLGSARSSSGCDDHAHSVWQSRICELRTMKSMTSWLKSK